MKEIGGYIELERYSLPILHSDALALNSARNCLGYLIEAKKIKRIKLPLFLCDCVKKICDKKGVEISYYRIDEDFRPYEIEMKEDEWLYVVNYYGQITNEIIKDLSDKYKKIIVDQVQAYFQMPIPGVDTIYTCRKFFGVPDGAFLYTDSVLEREMETDISFERMRFLLGRFERTASEFYGDYCHNEDNFDEEDIKSMSKLTRNLLQGINYENVRMLRTNNFKYLHDQLGTINQLRLCMIEGAFMYPFYIENAVEIRKKLQNKKIYISTLWPNVYKNVSQDSVEYRYAQNILPLPCDQRYTQDDMQYMVEEIMKCIN